MTSADIKTDIDKLKREMEIRSNRLDHHLQRYIETAKNVLPKYFSDWVERCVTQNPTAVQNAGRAGLSSLKQKFQAFLAKIPHAVDEALPKQR